MSYAHLLDQLIHESRYSLSEIVNLCKSKGINISPSYISKLRTGKKPPPSDDVSKVLAEVLNIDPEKLIMEAYKEKAPDKIKKILETGAKKQDLILSEASSEYAQRAGHAGRYSMVIEMADILENESIQLTAGGEPLNPEQRLLVAKALFVTQTGSGKTWSFLNLIKDRIKNKIPILGTIRAGIPLLSEQNIIGHLDILADMESKADFALYVRGDSMIGAGIQDNDVVVCKQRETAANGQIVVALVNGTETTLKFFIQENGKKLLRAANPEYKDIELGHGDQVQGYVVKILKDPPPINTYKEYIYFKEEHLQGWNEAIEKALACGIKPSAFIEFVEMQIELAKRLAEK